MTTHVRPTRHEFLSPIEEIIDEAKNGRMFILVDDEDRENEGDLIIPAQMATPAAINFMAMHGRGLICLALTKQRVDELGLEFMSRTNGTRHETAFTVSIEARHGVTTGISAADRGRTIAVAIDNASSREDIVSPGHVFPLVAREGGVLVRTGHTEAAVDVARLAGLNPSGVICEIMKEDGTMARLDDLVGFAQTHHLKIGTIRDLIIYRRRHNHNVKRLNKATFTSRYGGEWRAITFVNTAIDTETLVLVKGTINPAEEATLVRMHALGVYSDALGLESERSGLLPQAMEAIAQHGSGVLVLLNPHERLSQTTRYVSGDKLPAVTELRDYGVGAQILAELGIHDMILLTNSERTPIALDGYGLNIVKKQPL